MLLNMFFAASRLSKHLFLSSRFWFSGLVGNITSKTDFLGWNLHHRLIEVIMFLHELSLYHWRRKQAWNVLHCCAIILKCLWLNNIKENILHAVFCFSICLSLSNTYLIFVTSISSGASVKTNWMRGICSRLTRKGFLTLYL